MHATDPEGGRWYAGGALCPMSASRSSTRRCARVRVGGMGVLAAVATMTPMAAVATTSPTPSFPPLPPPPPCS